MSQTDRRSFLAATAIGTVAAALPATAFAQPSAAPAAPQLPQPMPARDTGLRIDPREFGAVVDGTTKDTAAVQQALDRCAVLGGGEVVLAGGTWLVGAIRVGSHTTLRVEEGATLQGSPDLADYPVLQVRWEGRWVPGHIGLVWAQEAQNVSLTGKGRILASDAIPGRVAQSGLRHPALLEFVDVRGLSVTDLHTQQNDMWSIHPVYCEDAVFRGLTVHGRADGIDVDSCRRVVIDRCDFDTVDDCISLKSGRGMEGNTIARPTEDVTITDCVFRDQRWACIGIGSETSAGIRRVLVERCQCLKAHTFAIYLKTRPGRGAFIRDITMRDLDVSGAGYGFLRLNFLDSGKQDQFPVGGADGIPDVGGFIFERIRVKDVPILVEAVNIHPDKPVDGFVLRDLSGTCGHGITLANMRDVVVENVDVKVFSGPLLAVNNVTGRGLVDTAAPLVPTVRPPDIVAADPPYRLGMTTGRPN
ncbi:glycoside hydrolase family 28 protein [Croceibacterium mercuriale]|uniref:glycoside hydrolase family 28 protein n=1 Tax=Croceibacterium mercuriale TaxID=1572751 RepID=UPI000689DBB1|nr:glycosyl hydrolase family 28 protein [Croceibacterium mercuriale]